MVNPLPNELIPAILDNFDADIPALLNCALVGRSWVYSSQRGIFRRVVLDSLPTLHIREYPTGIERYLKTAELLTASFNSNPRLASYVQSLTLLKFREFPDSCTGYQDAVYTVTTDIVHRLSIAGNLNKVMLLVSWNDLSSMLKVALTSMLKAPSITELWLSQFYIATFTEVVALLSHMSHLKGLKLGLFCDGWDIPSSPSSLELGSLEGTLSRNIKLDELSLQGDDESIAFATWLQKDWCPFDVKTLRRLHLNHDSGALIFTSSLSSVVC